MVKLFPVHIFRYQHPHKKLGKVTHTCYQRASTWRQEEPRGSLDSGRVIKDAVKVEFWLPPVDRTSEHLIKACWIAISL